MNELRNEECSKVAFYKWRSIFLFSRKTETRYRPNSFWIVKFTTFVLHKIALAYGHVRWRHCYIRSMYLLIYMDRIWEWRHRTWPEAEQILMQHKFCELHDAKRIRSISRLSFSRKKEKLIAIYKKSTLAGRGSCRAESRVSSLDIVN